MTGFIELTRDEGKIQRPEWVNVEAIDTFAQLPGEGRTVIRLRSGGSVYVSESVPDILRLLGAEGVSISHA